MSDELDSDVIYVRGLFETALAQQNGESSKSGRAITDMAGAVLFEDPAAEVMWVTWQSEVDLDEVPDDIHVWVGSDYYWREPDVDEVPEGYDPHIPLLDEYAD